jgi:hypothetical protein
MWWSLPEAQIHFPGNAINPTPKITFMSRVVGGPGRSSRGS